MTSALHPLSPRLDHCPDGLPAEAYLSDGWFERERKTLFARSWICAGRAGSFAPGAMRAVEVGAASVLVCRTKDDSFAAWHNTCRHRGSELCPPGAERPLGKLVTCPYHAWAYAAADGRLVSTAYAHPTDDFRPEGHGLIPVALRLWAGFVFLSTSGMPGELRADVPLATLDRWPMESVATGHRWQTELACNWKVFWENYSECLHCPGIHPELSDLVPVYGQGIMAANEAQDWTPEAPGAPNLKPGAESWTMNGAACGPAFPGLTDDERQAGFTFVTLWPSLYIVAHPDYVRAVRVEPLSPTRTRLVAEWYFAPETLARPDFDPVPVTDFAKIVMRQDGAACEMNQRGLASPGYRGSRLMPEEYEIHRFHRWVKKEMEETP